MKKVIYVIHFLSNDNELLFRISNNNNNYYYYIFYLVANNGIKLLL